MGLLRWLARRIAAEIPPPPPPPAAPRVDVAAALETLLVGSVRAAGEALAARSTADTEFIKQMAEMRNKSAAAALGAIGGRHTAERRRAQKLADPTYCPVCKRDNSRSTRAIIKWHIGKHAGPRPPMEVRENDQSATSRDAARTERPAPVQSPAGNPDGEHADQRTESTDKTG
jgi:hypothetical protein